MDLKPHVSKCALTSFFLQSQGRIIYCGGFQKIRGAMMSKNGQFSPERAVSGRYAPGVSIYF